MPSVFSTPDLCDAHPDSVRVAESVFQIFGGNPCFFGPIATIKCFEDNSRVKEVAATQGDGRVMVVDGGGSLNRALLGDLIAANAVENDWAGFVIFGCVRDVELLATLDLGVHALNRVPLKTDRKGVGETNLPVSFAGVTFNPGDYLYADNNGIVVSTSPLQMPN